MRNILYLVLILVFASCETYHYYPTFQNVPKNTEKNEISAAYFISDFTEGVAISYSVTNNFGIFTNYNTFGDSYLEPKAFITDYGLFAFKELKFFSDTNIKVTAALSTAYSFGKNRREHTYYDLNIKRAFIQPSIALSTPILDLGLSLRVSYLDYKLFKNLYNASTYSHLLDVGKKSFVFVEPTFYIGLGYKWIKLNYHINILYQLDNDRINYYDTRVSYLSLSLNMGLEK